MATDMKHWLGPAVDKENPTDEGSETLWEGQDRRGMEEPVGIWMDGGPQCVRETNARVHEIQTKTNEV